MPSDTSFQAHCHQAQWWFILIITQYLTNWEQLEDEKSESE